MKVLVIFGSKSDINIIKPIIGSLDAKGIEYDLNICSAHRTPDRLDEIMKKKYDLIITGAGLAAHLPGVIASKTITPVVGVPVGSNFDGLDAFLAIAQMPPGIPVLSVGVDANPAEYEFLFKDCSSVNLCGDLASKRVKSARNMLIEFGVSVSENDFDPAKININFFALNGGRPLKEAINVPLMEDSSDKDARTFLQKSKMGPVVGINRGENAALLSIMLINRSDIYSDKLIQYRKDMAAKVIESEMEVIEDVK